MSQNPNDFKGLEQLRDELKVQAHLFKADARDQWENLEKDFSKLRAETAPVREAASQSAEEIKEASKLLFDTVKEGYERIKRSMNS